MITKPFRVYKESFAMQGRFETSKFCCVTCNVLRFEKYDIGATNHAGPGPLPSFNQPDRNVMDHWVESSTSALVAK